MNPAPDRPRPTLSLNWNAGRRGGSPIVDNVLFGASWSHHGSFPTRTIHLYLGLWTLSLVLPKGGSDA
ncbi:hypothetical protein SEA_KLEVEY_57 [Arthrobacter phage Klevey]|uniref:Uncharacterized protein n=1 Tax=Arthrobacter phage Klevey TaxID=2867481 RepID=A0AAE9BS67_9CAUD|nr:hypothetical protein SEA_KLEVEY_57 [Arthrobacter phage Klevey]